MKSGSRIPDRGDIVWIDFNPTVGHEQGGRRPALVLSPAIYNGRSHLAVVCPITSHAKGYTFEVAIPAGLRLSGVILTDQLKALDWVTRGIEFIGKLPESVMLDVRDRVEALLGIDRA